VTGTVFFDSDSAVGIEAAAASGGSGYYVVSAVDSGGTESVQSLAVKPASMVSAGSSLVGCFITTAGQPVPQPSLLIWVLLVVAAALGVWLKALPQNAGFHVLIYNILMYSKGARLKEKD
jgi:hypothetical protein